MVQKLKIHIDYLIYLAKHKYYVFVEGWKLGLPLWTLLVHDLSKLLPSEWFGYAQWKSEQIKNESGGTLKNERGFLMSAFLHTHKRSKHHWQYWTYVCDQSGCIYSLEMPLRYVREMVADWRATQLIRFGNINVRPYYEENKEVILLHEETRRWLEAIIDYDYDNKSI
jgi:hypothetical protein